MFLTDRFNWTFWVPFHLWSGQVTCPGLGGWGGSQRLSRLQGPPSSGHSSVVMLMSSTELAHRGKGRPHSCVRVLATWWPWQNVRPDRHCASSWPVLSAPNKKRPPVL